eukprot:EG_transcript_6260
MAAGTALGLSGTAPAVTLSLRWRSPAAHAATAAAFAFTAAKAAVDAAALSVPARPGGPLSARRSDPECDGPAFACDESITVALGRLKPTVEVVLVVLLPNAGAAPPPCTAVRLRVLDAAGGVLADWPVAAAAFQESTEALICASLERRRDGGGWTVAVLGGVSPTAPFTGILQQLAEKRKLKAESVPQSVAPSMDASGPTFPSPAPPSPFAPPPPPLLPPPFLAEAAVDSNGQCASTCVPAEPAPHSVLDAPKPQPPSPSHSLSAEAPGAAGRTLLAAIGELSVDTSSTSSTSTDSMASEEAEAEGVEGEAPTEGPGPANPPQPQPRAAQDNDVPAVGEPEVVTHNAVGNGETVYAIQATDSQDDSVAADLARIEFLAGRSTTALKVLRTYGDELAQDCAQAAEAVVADLRAGWAGWSGPVSDALRGLEWRLAAVGRLLVTESVALDPTQHSQLLGALVSPSAATEGLRWVAEPWLDTRTPVPRVAEVVTERCHVCPGEPPTSLAAVVSQFGRDLRCLFRHYCLTGAGSNGHRPSSVKLAKILKTTTPPTTGTSLADLTASTSDLRLSLPQFTRLVGAAGIPFPGDVAHVWAAVLAQSRPGDRPLTTAVVASTVGFEEFLLLL